MSGSARIIGFKASGIASVRLSSLTPDFDHRNIIIEFGASGEAVVFVALLTYPMPVAGQVSAGGCSPGVTP
jgi:hypothetical protein